MFNTLVTNLPAAVPAPVSSTLLALDAHVLLVPVVFAFAVAVALVVERLRASRTQPPVLRVVTRPSTALVRSAA